MMGLKKKTNRWGSDYRKCQGQEKLAGGGWRPCIGLQVEGKELRDQRSRTRRGSLTWSDNLEHSLCILWEAPGTCSAARGEKFSECIAYFRSALPRYTYLCTYLQTALDTPLPKGPHDIGYRPGS